MPRPLLPPRGIFVPSTVQYDKTIPPAIRDTYSQLLGLAYGKSETPPVSLQQLSELFGKSISSLYGNMAFLRDRGALRWRTAQDGTIIISFPQGVSKGEAFFIDQTFNSKKLEKPVKEDEDINTLKEEFNPPPVSVKGHEKKEKGRYFSADLRQALLGAGVFKTKLPELALTELTEAEIMAILRKVQHEFGDEQKGGIVVHRIEHKEIPPDAYFNEPCEECAKFASHESNCLSGMREKYTCLDCGMLDCVCGDETEADEASGLAFDPPNLSIVRAWQTVLGQLQTQMPRASYDVWVRDTHPIGFEGSTLVVGAKNADSRDWLDDRLSSKVSRLLVGVLNTAETGVKFVVTE